MSSIHVYGDIKAPSHDADFNLGILNDQRIIINLHVCFVIVCWPIVCHFEVDYKKYPVPETVHFVLW